jgi:hypothetical protein
MNSTSRELEKVLKVSNNNATRIVKSRLNTGLMYREGRRMFLNEDIFVKVKSILTSMLKGIPYKSENL